MARIPFVLVGAVVGAILTSQSASGQVARLEVVPNPVRIAVGERVDVLASAYEADGDFATTTYRWTSSNPNIVSVEVEPDATEFATFIGMGPGSASVQVQASGRSQTVQVEVSGAAITIPSGTGTPTVLQVEPTRVQLLPTEEIQLRPLFLKDDGSLAQATPISFEWIGGAIGAVDASGRVTGITPGNALIRVASTTNPSLSRTVPVAVEQSPWTFTRPGLSLSPASEDTAHVVVPSQASRRVDPRKLTWRSANPNVAVVSPTGVVTAISAGRADIVATGFDQEARLAVNVHREVAELSVRKLAGDPVTIPMGGQGPFRVTPLAADGSAVPEAGVYWEVGDPTILSYSVPDSAAVGLRVGTTTLTVQSGRHTRTWTVNVVPAGLVLNVERVGLSLRDQFTLEASYADSTGRPLARASQVEWRSTDTRVVQVLADGTLRPVAAGRAQVIASTSGGGTDTATVFVQGSLLFVSTRSGSPDIFAVDLSRPTEVSQVTREPTQEFSPAYSPDGSRIAYVSDRDGNFEIYVMDADGSNPRRLTTTAAIEGGPAWTPDGRQIVYQSNADGTMQIWKMNADGSNQQQLTRGTGGVNEDPVVSPNGQEIAFSSTRDGNYEIYVMAADGSNQRNFTGSPAYETKPAWLTDSVIAFVREERSGGQLSRVVTAMNLRRETQALTGPQLLVRDFAVAVDAEIVVANIEAPSPTGGSSFRLFLIPVGEGTPVEIPRQGDRDQLLTPDVRRR